MPSPTTPAPRSLRPLVGILTALLLSTTTLVLAAPAHAAPTTVTGSVADEAGDAVAGATVTAGPVQGAGVATSDTTDVDGEYALALEPGRYTVQVTKAGWEPATLSDEEAPAELVVTSAGSVLVDGEPVDDAALDEVTLRSSTTWSFAGAAVTDRVTGGAVAGVTVAALRESDDTVAAVATTRTDGTYTLALPVGIFGLRLTSAGATHLQTWLGGATPASVTVRQGGALTIDANPATGFAALALEPASASTRHLLAGVVYDANVEPLDGATVSVLPAGATAGAVAVATTGPDTAPGQPLGAAGAYRLGVPAGSYWLRYDAPGHATAYLTDDEDEGPVTVTVGADGRVTAPGLELVGNVLPDVSLLLPAPTLVTAPSLDRTPVVGRTVVANPGRWQPGVVDTDDITIDWFLDGRPADEFSGGGYFQKFKVTTAAAGKRLSFRVTVDDPDGLRVPGEHTTPGVLVPRAASRLRATYAKGRLTVTLKVPTLNRPVGTVTVLAGRKKVAAARLRPAGKGRAVIRLAAPRKGSQRLTVVYGGTPAVAGAKTKVTVRR